jgi:hypothetical protein
LAISTAIDDWQSDYNSSFAREANNRVQQFHPANKASFAENYFQYNAVFCSMTQASKAYGVSQRLLGLSLR